MLCLAHYIRTKKDADFLSLLLSRIADYRVSTDHLQGMERVLAQVACPLLVNGLCSVYTARPATCRAYHSFDVSACERDSRDPESGPRVPMSNTRRSAVGAIASGNSRALKSLKLDIRDLEFVPALGIALQSERAFQQWLAGEDVFGPAYRPDIEIAQHNDLARRRLNPLPLR